MWVGADVDNVDAAEAVAEGMRCLAKLGFSPSSRISSCIRLFTMFLFQRGCLGLSFAPGGKL